MIKLQDSKAIVDQYQKALASTLQINPHPQFLPHSQLSARLSNDSPNKNKQDHQQSIQFGRTASKMVRIQFLQNKNVKQNQEVRLKRKMMTSSEKFQNRKKQTYSNSLRDQASKASNHEKSNHSNMTIASHTIRKMDYTISVFTKDFKFLDDHFALRRRLNPYLASGSEFQPGAQRKQPNKVLILQKDQNNKIAELLFKPEKGGRMTSEAKKQASNQRTLSVFRGGKDKAKMYSIQQFIPVRKNSSKREPFVFGLNQKQLNPERSRDKMLAYHDFIWKINYSNGLYIKPPEQDTMYKAYVGFGNNSNLIKGILKRRFWWTVSDKAQGSSFIWTQLKMNSIFRDSQQSSLTKLEDIYPQSLQFQENLKTQPIAKLQQGHQKIFNLCDLANWNRHMKKNRRSEGIISQKTYKNRAQFLNCKQIRRVQNSQKIVLHNHLQQNFYIGNKKSLFYHMKRYYELQSLDVFSAIPLTYHIIKGLDDPQFKQFLASFQQNEIKKKNGENIKNVWILKPGQNSNRGNGITVCYSLDDIKLRLKAKQRNSDGSLRTFIVQKYLQKPLLFKGRKFDIRHYLLLTSINGILKAYWFPEGYIRTSSSLFSLKRGTNLLVHLTNDAVQKNADDYGKYEKGNKISYEKFQSYLNKTLGKSHKNCFYENILPLMKNLTLQAVKATYMSLDPNKRQHNFELLGMDFMIDEDLKPWLIQINTNPCLELSSPLLSRLIPTIIQQAIRICVDPLFPPPEECQTNKRLYVGENILEENAFELIFDESTDRDSVFAVLGSKSKVDFIMGKIQEDVQTFQNEGAEEWQSKQF